MGDRCFIEITMRRADFERLKLKEYFCNSVEDKIGAPGLVTATDCEANYGYVNELCIWAQEAPFIGYHGNGDGYCAAAFAGDGVGYSETYCLDSPEAGQIVVPVDADGKPTEGGKKTLHEYLETHKQACAALGLCRRCHCGAPYCRCKEDK